MAETVADRVTKAIIMTENKRSQSHPKRLVIAGGVAANKNLRSALLATAATYGFELIAPPPALCTDNGAMIAWAGGEDLARGVSHSLKFPAKSRWPLDEKVKPLIGSGKAGAKV